MAPRKKVVRTTSDGYSSGKIVTDGCDYSKTGGKTSESSTNGGVSHGCDYSGGKTGKSSTNGGVSLEPRRIENLNPA